MTVATEAPDVAGVVRALSEAGVQFVVIGEPREGSPLRLVVSQHPTNLDALGRVLDRLGATVHGATADPTSAAPSDARGSRDARDSRGPRDGQDPGPRRVGDPMGTISLTTPSCDLELLFGGPRRSLYAEIAARATPREVGGLEVPWIGALPELEPPPPRTGRELGRRLLSLVEGLAHRMERGDGGTGADEGGTGA